MKTGKKRAPALQKADKSRRYPLSEAVSLVKELAFANFDESVDVAVRLGVDPKHADQMVRGAIVLPNGVGKATRVLVFAKGDKEQEARDAGADHVGGEDLQHHREPQLFRGFCSRFRRMGHAVGDRGNPICLDYPEGLHLGQLGPTCILHLIQDFLHPTPVHIELFRVQERSVSPYTMPVHGGQGLCGGFRESVGRDSGLVQVGNTLG